VRPFFGRRAVREPDNHLLGILAGTVTDDPFQLVQHAKISIKEVLTGPA
jgi:hypothetical protein